MTIIGLVFHTDLRPGFAAELTNFSLFLLLLWSLLMGGRGPGKRKDTHTHTKQKKDEEGKQSLNNGFLSYVYMLYIQHCLSPLFSPSYYPSTVFPRERERERERSTRHFCLSLRPARIIFMSIPYYTVCCAVRVQLERARKTFSFFFLYVHI